MLNCTVRIFINFIIISFKLCHTSTCAMAVPIKTVT